MVVSGDDVSEEVGAQMLCDLLEADGHDVIFAGGGIANDELVSQTNTLDVDCLVIFGAVSGTVPETRKLIDRLQTIGANDKMQVAVGGGVFSRAPGLAEEIGADLFAENITVTFDLVQDTLALKLKSSTDDARRGRRPKAQAQGGKIRSEDTQDQESEETADISSEAAE